MGKRPLYCGANDDGSFGFASEAMALTERYDSIYQFTPGHYIHVPISSNQQMVMINPVPWFDFDTLMPVPSNNREIDIINKSIRKYQKMNKSRLEKLIKDKVWEAVIERVRMSDVLVGCYLSGGLDSSLVTALASKVIGPDMHTFTIGLEGSVDIAAAKKVAKHLGIEKNHHVYIVTMQDIYNILPEVIRHASTFDMTSIRCSCYQYLLSSYIARDTDIKVLLTGEGADEMCPGYFEFHDQFKRTDEEFKQLVKTRMKELHLFDLLRSDRAAAAHGLEVRMPLLDERVIRIFHNIPVHLRRFGSNEEGMEKQLLRDAFHDSNKTLDKQILPMDILYRRKHAFSDGVNGKKSDSEDVVVSYNEVEKKAKELFDSFHQNNNGDAMKFLYDSYSYHLPPTSYEAGWYRRLFKKAYPSKNHASMIPKFWLPNIPGHNITDPSATVLPGFKQDKM